MMRLISNMASSKEYAFKREDMVGTGLYETAHKIITQ